MADRVVKGRRHVAGTRPTYARVYGVAVLFGVKHLIISGGGRV